jgi:hypothetical protein
MSDIKVWAIIIVAASVLVYAGLPFIISVGLMAALGVILGKK